MTISPSFTRCRLHDPVEHLSVPVRSAGRQGVQVPLSEDEERILQEIAQRFYEDDPTFAREVSETTLYRHTVRRMKWSIVGLVVGAVFLVATLSVSYLISFAGFLVMLVCALVFERNLRKLGKAGLNQLTRTVRANGMRDALGGERFNRDDDDDPDRDAE